MPNLLELVVDGVPDGEPFRSLQALLTATAAALEEVSEDALGRSALEQKVQRVRLAEGAPGVSCSQGALTVTAHLAQGSAGRLSDADLRAAIDRAL